MGASSTSTMYAWRAGSAARYSRWTSSLVLGLRPHQITNCKSANQDAKSSRSWSDVGLMFTATPRIVFSLERLFTVHRGERRLVYFRLDVASMVRLSLCCGILIALGFAAFPIASIASCVPGTKPSYQDISALYFRSEGVSEPVAIRRGKTVQPGACPVTVKLYVSPSDVEKGRRPILLLRRPLGRIAALLRRSNNPKYRRFAATHLQSTRCGAGALSIPFGSLPPAAYDSKLLALFDDFTRAIYQSEWNLEDIY